jgi:peptidyl-prolyl cis-trans isomerase C
VATAAREKKVNQVKRQLLEEILKKRLLIKEQVRRGLDKSEEYERNLSEYKNSALFGLFLTKMIIADVRVTNADMTAYYEEHGGEYMFPEMMRITSLVFKNKNNAESALARLKKGADINWVRSNAEGLVAHEDAEELSFEGSVLSTKALPADMHETLAGARTGEFRLYEAPGGRYSVLVVLDVIPARRQPFENVRETIQGKVFDAKVNQSIEDWARKLRAASHVEVYLTGMEL